MARSTLRSVDLVDAVLARIGALDQQGPMLGALTYLAPKQARAAAANSDARRARGDAPGLLEGIPVLVKDNIEVAGWPTRAGSQALVGLVAEQDAEVVKRLSRAGAILVGKTAMHELASGITGASSLTGFARNPHALDRSPGGSSSGSGVAVAAGYVPLAIGTDTAGSVQIPASCNGLYALRATRGSLPLGGIVPLCPTQDMPGPITRNAADLDRAYAVLAGNTFSPHARPTKTLAIGRYDEWFDADSVEVTALCRDALSRLEAAGVRLTRAKLGDLRAEVESANVIDYEFDEALRTFLGARSTSPVDSIAAIRASGLHHANLTHVLARRDRHPGSNTSAYRDARRRQDALRECVERCLDDQKLDFLAYPTLRHPPATRGGPQTGSNGLLAPVTGLPGLNLPVGLDSGGLPVGLHLLARAGDEQSLLQIARAWCEITNPAAYPAALKP